MPPPRNNRVTAKSLGSTQPMCARVPKKGACGEGVFPGKAPGCWRVRAGSSFDALLPLDFQDAQGVQRVFHSRAFFAGNLAVQRLTSANGVFHGFYAKLKLDRVGLENSSFIERPPVILDHGALLRGRILCSSAGSVSAVAYQAG